MNPQEIGSRLAALLAPGEPVTEPGQTPRESPDAAPATGVTPGAGQGPLDAPDAARAAASRRRSRSGGTPCPVT